MKLIVSFLPISLELRVTSVYMVSAQPVCLIHVLAEGMVKFLSVVFEFCSCSNLLLRYDCFYW